MTTDEIPLPGDPPDEPANPAEQQLDHYLAGESLEGGSSATRDNLPSNGHKAALLEALREMEGASRWNSAQAWRSVSAAMHAPTVSSRTWTRPRVVAMRLAASVALIVGAATIARTVMQRPEPATSPVAMMELTTGPGEKREVMLPDGSRVVLAPRSVLRYPAQFAGSKRDVSLTGHAFFTVAKASTRPFEVHTPGALVSVLGTEFDVFDDAVQNVVRVVVESGRVRLRAAQSDSSAPVLTARQVGYLQRASGALQVDTGAVLDNFLRWREGRLHFDRRALKDVVTELSAWYDVDFTLDSALARRTISAELRVGQGVALSHVLQALTLPLNARFTINGRVVSVFAQ